ncbi:glycosyltransferase involved in cell wall biosynthesis [Lysobacter niabensis]|uniref:Glycosyltransferase involved in cell wall biosynthesis n=1 Tax=Agrilutibacter niabensis TaxID=380628 RepID=A0ABU1VKF3_9GAMM|nr:glycosyltransferase family 2 protein [Lysobacter niabensis]MDR7097939.1 glycosyltransferase involved in cell wall biosynthesis [Lysobacter niabensis]
MPRDLLTVVVAAFNEAQALPLLHPRVRAALDGMPDVDGRVLYVDDGSHDATWTVLQQIAANDAGVGLLRLSRNFGKEAALTAGLDHVGAGAALILDADGQDPPELIPQFVAKWREGYDDVHGTRMEREGESWLKRGTAHAFYRVIGRLSHTPIPADTGDFRLLSPRSLAALRQLRERHRFMKGLFGWVGFNSTAIPYHRDARSAGTSKFNLWRLWNFALEGITSFSTAPLRLATYLGLLTAAVAFLYALWVVLKAMFWGDPVAGWPTMMAVILFLGGVQLIALGLIGEYLGRLYDEAKQRPLYLVDAWRPAAGVFSASSVGIEGEGHAYRAAAARSENPGDLRDRA